MTAMTSFSLLDLWTGWGVWIASALWLIFSSDNSSLFISFQSWWAILRAAVGKRKKKKKDLLTPSFKSLSNSHYKESIWAQCFAGHPRNNRKQERKKKNQFKLNLTKRFKNYPNTCFGGKKSTSGWFNAKSGRPSLKEKYTSY